MPDALHSLPAARPAPLTAAERQRRHRAKTKAQAAAFGSTAAGRAFSEVQRLRLEVDALTLYRADAKAKALRTAEAMAQQGQELTHARQRLHRLRMVLLASLPRLTPGGRQQLRQALKEADFIAWLDTG